MSTDRAHFAALGTTAVVLAARDDSVAEATRAVMVEIAAIDAACSRFRADSELTAVNTSPGRFVTVSATLMHAVRVALRAAALTGGCVDPTVGGAVRSLGYDRDFQLVADDGPPLRIRWNTAPDWRNIRVDDRASAVCVPVGVELDLGATAKALAVDRAAEAAAAAAGVGVLVSIGGDIAVAGPSPRHGWPTLVAEDHATDDEHAGQTIVLTGGGLATSGTTVRHWRRGAVELHHLIDPRTGGPVVTPWRTVSVAAASCVDANIASTAAVVMGVDAPNWLAARALPSRLVGRDGRILAVAGWPSDDAASADPDGDRPPGHRGEPATVESRG